MGVERNDLAAALVASRWRGWFLAAVAVGAALGFALLSGRPEPGRLELQPDVDSVTLRATVQPAAALALEVQIAGQGARRLESTGVASEHVFHVDHVERGAWVSAQAVAGARRGPPLAFAYRSLGAEDVTVESAPDGLHVRLTVARPLTCALLLHTPRGVVRVVSDAVATHHEIVLGKRLMPFAQDVLVQLADHGAKAEERLAWDDAARRAYLTGAAEWLIAEVERLVPPVFASSESGPSSLFDQVYSTTKDAAAGVLPSAQAGLNARLMKVLPELPPYWFLEQLGGPSGVLDRRDLSPALVARFDSALHWLEVFDMALYVRELPGHYPFYLLYGAHVGPSLRSRLGPASSVPLIPGGLDSREDYLLVPDMQVTRDTLRWNGGLPKTFVATCVVTLGPPMAGRKAEIEAWLKLRGGTFVDVIVNGHHAVRLCRPGKAPLEGARTELFGGFDAGLLIEGENFIELRCLGMPPVIENHELDHGAVVYPPGFTLRIKD